MVGPRSELSGSEGLEEREADVDPLFVLEAVEVGIVLEMETEEKCVPSSPRPVSFLVGVFCCSVKDPRGVASIKEIHEDTFGGGWHILKLCGICEEKFVRINEVSSSSFNS